MLLPLLHGKIILGVHRYMLASTRRGDKDRQSEEYNILSMSMIKLQI